MRKPVVGLLVALGAAAAGFFWGRHLRDEAKRREAAAQAVPAQAPAPQPQEEPLQAAEPLPADLPTDSSRGDSVPQSLE